MSHYIFLNFLTSMSQQDTQSAPAPMQAAPVPRARKRQSYEQLTKRAVDLFVSSVLLCLLSPLFLAVALLVWISDGRPVFYPRRVVGSKGEFAAYKFRTMCRDADAILASDPDLRNAFAANFKLKSDPRVTRIGALLRKYSLDELPQLVNV